MSNEAQLSFELGKKLYKAKKDREAVSAFAKAIRLDPDNLEYRIEYSRSLGQIGQRGLYVGNLVRPKGVTTDSDGNVYIVESYYDHLLIYNQGGEFLLPIGGTGTDIGSFYLPAGIWSDNRDRIFIADMFNARVVIFRYVGAGA